MSPATRAYCDENRESERASGALRGAVLAALRACTDPNGGISGTLANSDNSVDCDIAIAAS